jgi:hypothetical protein
MAGSLRSAGNDAASPTNGLKAKRRTARPRTLLGWREWVSFPEHGVPWIKAKVDTGARTSAIHARNLVRFTRGGKQWVRFTVSPWQRSSNDSVEIETVLHDERWVRSSTGQEEHRPVVLLPVAIAGELRTVELTLSHRPQMGFRMLLGRQALRGSYQVDPSRSYLGPRPSAEIRRQNRHQVSR